MPSSAFPVSPSSGRTMQRAYLAASSRWLLLLLLLAGATERADAKALGATFDERQEGKVNVQIDVKDVQIVALVGSDMFEDYTNYDYAYDYADFTIKPRPTSSKPSSSESTSPKPSSTTVSGGSVDSNAIDAAVKNETLNATTASTSSEQPIVIGNSTILVIPEILANASDVGTTTTTRSVTSTLLSSSTSSEIGKPIDGQTKRPQAIAEPRKRCPVGFHLKSGKCFKSNLPVFPPSLMESIMRAAGK